MTVIAQGTQINFSTIPKSGTILVYSHQDDDLIWMQPFWQITEKFIGGAMPATPSFNTIINQQQIFINDNGYNIDYETNWFSPWGTITQQEYSGYYWHNYPEYQYLSVDHLIAFWNDNDIQLVRNEINRIKSKIEQFIADPGVSRIITHDNWGEYGHQQHVVTNRAVRELAVKYRKDVWMLGCTISSGIFTDISVPNGITYTLGSFNNPSLFTGIRSIYLANNCWTWYSDIVPSGDHRFIKIVDGGSDKSNLLRGDEITYPGPAQLEQGAYIFDGNDDYLTLEGNNNSSFTIALKIRPDQIREMDISAMSEYPLSTYNDRNLYLTGDGHIIARINDGSSRTLTSMAVVSAGTWTHLAITGNGTSLRLYINGMPDRTITTGTAITNYSTPEFILGQATMTGSYFQGQINNVIFYNRVLSDNEIAQLSGMVYTIISGAGIGGTINPSGNVSVVAGTSRTFVISPDAGYRIADVLADNVSAGSVSSYTFPSVTSNHNISAIFSSSTSYTINSSAGTGGSINPSGNVTVYEGTDQTFTITPQLGYRISDIKVDGISAGTVSSYTFSNISVSHTIEAAFEITPVHTITASTGVGGSVTPSGITSVNEGTNLTYFITPAAGYSISEVMADGISLGAVSTYTFSNITSNHIISATFSVLTYTLTGSAGNNGSISPSGSLTVNYGTSQTYSISPGTGYQISNVLVDNVSVGTPSVFTFSNISASHTITASFSVITNTIAATAGSGGNITPQGNVPVPYMLNQTFIISANSGFLISDVLVDNVSVGPVTSFTINNVTSGHTISANFTPITYTITGSAGTGGSIDPMGNVIVNHGSNRTFTINPAFGYQVSDVRIDNISVGPLSSYTFSNIVTNHTISATFTTAIYSISASSGAGGSISPSGIVAATHGTSRTFSIIPEIGYRISDVRVDNNSVGNVASYTFANISSNHSITATFTILTFTLTSQSGFGGSVSPEGNITVNYGTSRTFTIVPNTGYIISDVIVDNVSSGPVASYTFNNITGNHTISANFSILAYTISGNTGTGGSITPAGSSRVNYGSNPVYTITPDEGFSISDVKIDNISAGAISSYTFSNVSSDHTIYATFTPISFNITSSSGQGGYIDPQGITTVIYGTDRNFSITPVAGYQVDDVVVDNNSAGKVSEFTFTNIKTDHSIHATFSVITHTITAESNEGGSVSPSGKTILNYGSNQTYSFTPDHGFMVSDVKIDNLSIGAVSSHSFNNITNNHTISVIFKPIPIYTISALSGTGGDITPSGIVSVLEGSDQNYSIIPNQGYRILEVFADNQSIGAISEYTFRNVASNHQISAKFTTSTSVNVYPNPFVNDFKIYIATPDEAKFELSITDANGKIFYTQDQINGNTVIPVTLHIPQGLYILKVFTGIKKIATIKIIKS
jgi:hypothetical protein